LVRDVLSERMKNTNSVLHYTSLEQPKVRKRTIVTVVVSAIALAAVMFLVVR
jgi:hypothetical protein